MLGFDKFVPRYPAVVIKQESLVSIQHANVRAGIQIKHGVLPTEDCIMCECSKLVVAQPMGKFSYLAFHFAKQLQILH